MILNPGGLLGIRRQQPDPLKPVFFGLKQLALLFQHLCACSKLLELLRVHESVAVFANE